MYPGIPHVAVLLADRYEILGMLGEGGMGTVYKARDRELDETVALKVLRPDLVQEQDKLDRFRSEVKLARRVTHASVARIYDLGEHGNLKFLTMEYVDGESLAALLGRGPRLPSARAMEIAAGICSGLAAVHQAGIVHRDLKPENVMLSRGGRVVVMDFGIAQLVSSNRHQPSARIGTPAYMAPEQLEGGEVDERSDIYALGVVLYELFVGESPWHGHEPSRIAYARLALPPPDPKQRRPELPDRLAALVHRCLARYAQDRPGSVEEIAMALACATLPSATLPPRFALPPEVLVDLQSARFKRVAVLPFRNADGPEHDYRADGLTDDLIDLLSMSPGLRVRSRGSVMRHKAADRDVREVGRELDVQMVVDGSVRRSGGMVRITARLISVADGFQLWARRFDRPEAELLAINDETAKGIAEALAVEINAPPHPIPDDPEVADLYLRARAAYHLFFSNTDGESIRLFEQALARAPDDARILAGYAMARARFTGAEAVVGTSAREAADRAVRLEPTLAESHLAVATVALNAGDTVSAVRPLRRAIRLTPTSATAHDLLGRILCETTLADAARRHLEAAISLDPEIELSRLSLCRLHELAGDSLRADAVMEIGAGRNVSFPALARALLWRRDARRAEEVLRSFIPDNASLRVSHALLELTAFGTSPLPLLQPFQDPARSSARRRAFFSQLEAEALCVLGSGEQAFAALERAADDGLSDVAWMDRCPSLAPIRPDPRFATLRERLAARAAQIEVQYLAPET